MMPVAVILFYAVITIALGWTSVVCCRRAQHMWRCAVLADLPFCDACRPSSARIEREIDAGIKRHCASCRRDLSKSRTAWFGPMPRRPGRGFALSALFLALLAANISFTLWWFPEVVWHRFVPVEALLVERRTPWLSEFAENELARRVLDPDRGLPAEVVATLVEGVLAHQQDLDEAWFESRGQIVDCAWYVGLLTPDQIQRWIEQSLIGSGITIDKRWYYGRDGDLELKTQFIRRGAWVLPKDEQCRIVRTVLNGEVRDHPEGLQSVGSSRSPDWMDFTNVLESPRTVQGRNHLEWVCRLECSVPGQPQLGKHTWFRAYACDFEVTETAVRVTSNTFRALPVTDLDM